MPRRWSWAFGSSSPRSSSTDFHIIEVNFNGLQDDGERRYFNSLPTNFNLPSGAVDRLREVAGRLLRQSADWKGLLQELHGSEADGAAAVPERPGHPR